MVGLSKENGGDGFGWIEVEVAMRRGKGWQAGWRGWGIAAAVVWLCAGAGWAQRVDPYFRGVRSDANVYVAPIGSSIQKVAVLPFKAPTELIGQSVSDMLVTELLRARRYALVERGQMDQVLGEAELALAGLSDSAALEVGRMLGADGVIIGTVDEYATVAHRGRSYPVVGASLRLIDCDSGRVMWSVGHARRSASPLDTLSGHGRVVMHEMVGALVQNWHVQRQVEARFDNARDNRDKPGDLVGMHGDPVMPAAFVAEPPEPPADFQVSDFGLREARVSWRAPPDRSLQYRVERADSPSGPFELVAAVAASRGGFVDRGTANAPLLDATTYYYRLVAVGRDGLESEPSDTRESMMAPPPEPPAQVEGRASAARAVTLEWGASASDGVVSYRVERRGAGEAEFQVVGEVRGTRFGEGGTPASPLKDSTAYLYRVRAINRVGAADEEWTALSSLRGRDRTALLDGGREPGFLPDATAYEYAVRAVNAVGAESAASAVARAVTRDVPPPVAGLSAMTGLPRRVELSWEASADDPVVAYEIERAAGDGEFEHLARVTGRDQTAYADYGGRVPRGLRGASRAGLDDAATYRYRLRAVNTAGAVSEWSEAVASTTKPVPRAPGRLRASQRRARVIGLVWGANPERDIERYMVECSGLPDRGFAAAGAVAAGEPRGLKQEGLPPDLTRYYRVKAVDADGLESEWSEVAEGTTKPLPGAPVDLSAEWVEDGTRLTWSAPPESDVVEYRVWGKKLFGQDEWARCAERECWIERARIGSRGVVAVSAVDADGLESVFSAWLEIRPPR